ncbi:MAG TPA: F0F1 ATP synthase subunit B [Streptosporangiaceae bacterium]|nr:F0F1 ATP synthase subunit B [Streptosporangiaceae bacterium]
MHAMILAAAAQEQDPLVPSWTELIVGLITFAIIFFGFWKLILPRFHTMLETRTDQIEGGLKRAEEAQEEANQVLAEYRAQLADARHEAARLREAAKEEAAQIVAQGRADGVAEGQRMIEAANARIETERQQALTALRAEVGAMAVELASKIVGESLADEARQSRMVDRFLAEIEAEPASGVTAR